MFLLILGEEEVVLAAFVFVLEKTVFSLAERAPAKTSRNNRPGSGNIHERRDLQVWSGHTNFISVHFEESLNANTFLDK